MDNGRPICFDADFSCCVMFDNRESRTRGRVFLQAEAPGTGMIFELLEDIVKLVFIVAAFYFALSTFARKKKPGFTETLEKRRLAILFGLVLVVLAIKISEDVLGGESGPVDNAVLLYIHSYIPGFMTPFFAAITVTGSAKFLFPVTIFLTVLLLLARRSSEALFLSASVISAALTVFIIKTMVGRHRPMLWETEYYWGSSFPSGHTLAVAAFATAVTLIVLKFRPVSKRIVMIVVFLWIFLVGLSRLVLGVHWPTDVLAAACIGTFLPLAIKVIIHFQRT
jgi:undecaprenyl-diphosphatase